MPVTPQYQNGLTATKNPYTFFKRASLGSPETHTSVPSVSASSFGDQCLRDLRALFINKPRCTCNEKACYFV